MGMAQGVSSVIEVENLKKVYPDGTHALDGVSLEVAEGEVFGFLGPNGAGKTTAIRILVTLLSKTSGTARVGGFDVKDDARNIRRLIGYAGHLAQALVHRPPLVFLDDADDEAVHRAARALAGIAGAGVPASVDRSISLALPDAGRALSDLVRRLDETGVKIARLSVASPHLDEVFLKYTGERMRAEEASGAAKSSVSRTLERR